MNLNTITFNNTNTVYRQQIISLEKLKKQNAKIKNLYKAFVISLLFFSFFLYRFLFQQKAQKNCVTDNLHLKTYNLNRWINYNISNVILGIAQIMVDVNVFGITFYWMIFVKNFRFPVTTAFFFNFRTIVLKIYTMPYISYTIWRNPGFPSISVPYDHTTDFFYSGHAGSAAYLFLQAHKLNLPKWIQIYLFFCFLYMICMLITMRVHYTIDVFGGILYGNYFYLIVSKNLNFFDHIMNAPHRIVEIVKEKIGNKMGKQTDETSLYEIQQER